MLFNKMSAKEYEAMKAKDTELGLESKPSYFNFCTESELSEIGDMLQTHHFYDEYNNVICSPVVTVKVKLFKSFSICSTVGGSLNTFLRKDSRLFDKTHVR